MRIVNFFFKYRKLIVILNVITFVIPYAAVFYYLGYAVSMRGYLNSVSEKGFLNKISFGLDLAFIVLLTAYFYFGMEEWVLSNIGKVQIGSLLYLLSSASCKFVLLPSKFGGKSSLWLLLFPQLFHLTRGGNVYMDLSNFESDYNAH